MQEIILSKKPWFNLIQQEKEDKTGTLDLSSAGLSHIPSEIRKLDWLEKIDLSSNSISIIENLPASLATFVANETQTRTYTESKQKIFPILISDCDYENSKIRSNEIVPKSEDSADLLAVNEWTNTDKALMVVINKLKTLILSNHIA